MRPIGKVVNFSPKGSVVVRATMTPRIGQFVVGRKGEPVGKIVRITGPVDSPYVLVQPGVKEDGSLFRLAGKPVFIDDRQPQRRERRSDDQRGPGRKQERSGGRRLEGGSRSSSERGRRNDRRPFTGNRSQGRRK